MHFLKQSGLYVLLCGIAQVNNSQATSDRIHPRQTNNSSPVTADSASLKTWWHATGTRNTRTPVADGDVRQSHAYSIQVSVGVNGTFYDSFAYETIPRSGKGKLCHPDKPDICDEDDQITIEADIGVTMAWSQFLYKEDAMVKVTRLDGKAISAADVTIRPTSRKFDFTASGDSLFIKVPFTPDTNGARFSVEFRDDIYEYRTEKLETQSHYVQDINETGQYYVGSYTDQMPVVGREPLNSLLIFASPFPDENMVPSNQTDIFNVQPGFVADLLNVQQSVVSFGPGVYWFSGTNRAVLNPSVTWVYLAPGAYVKGAIEYNNGQSLLKASGFGVLSGEQYVYQANTADGYKNSKSDSASVKMWRGNNVSAEQSWTMNGITTSTPPFNGMDFYDSDGNAPPDGFSVDVYDYKQVGGFYSQTDGLEMYGNGHLRDIFYHTGDDTIKAYYSGVVVERIIVWKTDNAPVIQLGWYPRSIQNIRIHQVDVIHSRYYSFLQYAPRALIGSAASYTNVSSTGTANINTTISNITVSNIRSEGLSPGLLSLNMLSNYAGLYIDGAWIEEFSPVPELGTSTVTGFTDETQQNERVSLGNPSSNNTSSMGLVISRYMVGNTPVSFDASNWDATTAGRLNVDEIYWGKWEVQ